MTTKIRRRVIFDPDRYLFVYADTGTPLTFDECESLGLDGTLRDVPRTGRHTIRAELEVSE